MRLRDIGDADVCSAAGEAVAVRAAVLVSEGESNVSWGGQLWPYRPLALHPGRYTLRVRGEDVGTLQIQAVHVTERGVADFLGEGTPSDALLRLIVAGGAAHPGRSPRFPRVAGEVEPTVLAMLFGSVGGVLRGVLTAPLRLTTRRRSGGPARLRKGDKPSRMARRA